MFKIKSAVGRDYNVDLDDVLPTKRALKALGYFETPPYGATKYPDEPMFHGIERFQKDHGLRIDGVMKPGGETESMLKSVLSRGINSTDSKQADSGNCPPGYQETTESICIPGTNFCIHRKRCLPIGSVNPPRG